ncbi:MAG: C-terminal target protein, partial [Verrucomicrobiales bacterium]|nr:C-terminal target protein [Verrucomicrobiales bacterium]
MSALIRKEMRALVPTWLATLALAVVPMWLYALKNKGEWLVPTYRDLYQIAHLLQAQTDFILFTIYCFALGAVVLAVIPFGHELNARTFGFLLSQPTSRKVVWRSKALPLAAALLVNLGVYMLSLRLALTWASGITSTKEGWTNFTDMLLAAPIVALLAYSGGLWTTVLFRTNLGALGITIVAPFAVMMLEQGVFGSLAPHSLDYLMPWSLVAYGVAGIFFARWYLIRAQDVPWGGGNVWLPTGKSKGWRRFSEIHRGHRFVVLIKKELQLQQVSMFIAALLLAVHLGAFVIRLFNQGHTRSTVWLVINDIWIVWFALPLVIGSLSIAEERRLATHEAALTQPVSRWSQLLIKFLTSITLAIFFGVVVPWTLEHVWQSIGPASELMASVHWRDLLAATAIITLCAFFGSTIGRNTIEAVCIGVVLVPIAAAGLAFLSFNAFTGGSIPRYGLLTWYIFLSIFAPTVLWLMWKNYQRTRVGTANLVFTFGIFAAALCIGWGAASFTWNRGWEYFMSLEPKHVLPVMHIGDGAKVATGGRHAFALLPDGRLWMAEFRYDIRYGAERDLDDRKHVVGVALNNARFLPGSNWVDLALGWEPFAIKSDGTLWQLARGHYETNANQKKSWTFDPPHQFGTDSDWASVVSADRFALALKRDGSLWGCGFNSSGQLGPGPIENLNSFKPVWPDARWKSVFASSGRCMGTKTDLTPWQWGSEIRYAPAQAIPDFTAQPSEFTGTNWTSFAHDVGEIALATRSDKTLWVFMPTNRLGPRWEFFGQAVDRAGLQQLGTKHDWETLTG